MEITRNIILDLLPLYLDGDASPDTQALVEKYLQADPELAEMAEQSRLMDKPQDVPVPLKKEKQMKAYEEAQRLILHRILILGAVIAFAILSLLGIALLIIFMFVSV